MGEPSTESKVATTSWPRRALAAIIGAGTVAGAFVAIDQARNILFEPDPERGVVTIDDVEESGPETLSDYAASHPDLTRLLSDGREAPADRAVAMTPVAFEDTTSPPRSPETTDGESQSEPTSEAPTVTLPTTPSEAPSPPAPSPPEALAEVEDQADHTAARMASHASEFGGIDVDPSDWKHLMPPSLLDVRTMRTGEPGSASRGAAPAAHGASAGGGGGLSPEAIAGRELLGALERFTKKTRAGEYAGTVLEIEVTLDGFQDRPVQLIYSLEGGRVSGLWKRSRITWVLLADRGVEKGVVKVWVPQLKRPDRYNVNVYVKRGGARLAHHRHRIAIH